MKSNCAFKGNSNSLIIVVLKDILKDTLLILDALVKGREGEPYQNPILEFINM